MEEQRRKIASRDSLSVAPVTWIAPNHPRVNALNTPQEPASIEWHGTVEMEKLRQKRTKIVATIGPASSDPAIMRSLFTYGANVLRLNFSHGTPETHAAVIANARKISAELGLHTAILQDLPGPKVRTGKLTDGVEFVRLERGQPFLLTTNDIGGSVSGVSVQYKDLPKDVAVGNRIYLQDGQITLRIIAKTDTDIETTVEFGGDLRSTQGINYPDGSLNITSVTERDFEFLAFGLEHNVDYVAVSFVRSADDINRVKAFMSERGKTVPVLAKIEKHEALEDLDNIIDAADGIMVARGDLGIEIPLEQVPLVQKTIIAKCNRASKPVVTATQMLESMTFNSKPTRAEVTDVANAILDGTDAVMLSGETARGQYPTEAVRTMAEIACEVEKNYPHSTLRDRRLAGVSPTIATSIAEAATRASEELFIPFIVTGTTTGNTAHHIAAFRPRARIVALTPNDAVARRLALVWGTESLLIDRYSSIDVLLYMVEQRMTQAGLVAPKDLIAFTTGMPVGAGGTNVLKIHQIP
jgi:pyruvate kinase